MHVLWQITTWDEGDLKDHRAKFEVSSITMALCGLAQPMSKQSNAYVGMIIWSGVLYDYLCSI